MTSEIILSITKLFFGGIICFFAIFLLSKSREADWMCIVTGCLLSYVFIVFDMLISFGLIPFSSETIYTIFCVLKISIPCIFIIAALVIKIIKTRQ